MKEIKIEIIDTTRQIGDLVDWLVAPPIPYLSTMYIDLEGVNLCREGSLSILTLLLDTETPTHSVYLIDVHILSAQAFNTTGVEKKTLKDILQDESISKVSFDVRNDSDALFSHFGVQLQGVEDVQLMESATRKTTTSRRLLNGLAKCVEKNVRMSLRGSGLGGWKQAKEKGERLFKPDCGGSYEVFNQRPIPEEIIDYCVGDVQCLPELRDKFWGTRDSHGESWSKKNLQNASRRLREQSTKPTAGIRHWLRGAQTRIGFWISGIKWLLLVITSSMRTLIRMRTGQKEIGTMIGTTMIMETGREKNGKGLHLDSGYSEGRLRIA